MGAQAGHAPPGSNVALLRRLSAEQLLRAFEDLGPTATISDRFPNLSGVELHNVVPSSCPAGLSERFVPADVALQFPSFLESRGRTSSARHLSWPRRAVWMSV